MPFIGDAIGKILRGGEEVGAVTLARFYAIHTIWLPWIVFGLVGLHLLFVRHLGSSGLPQNTPTDTNAGKPFYPDQLFEDSVAILILFSILVVMALFVPVPTEAIADPTDASYDPRPEWYFLFLFQLLKYFEGSLEVVGTFVIPTLAILLLFLVPFLARKERLPIRKRPVALAITCISVLTLVSLTILGMRSPRLNSTSATVTGAEQLEPSSSVDSEVFDFGLEED